MFLFLAGCFMPLDFVVIVVVVVVKIKLGDDLFPKSSDCKNVLLYMP